MIRDDAEETVVVQQIPKLSRQEVEMNGESGAVRFSVVSFVTRN